MELMLVTPISCTGRSCLQLLHNAWRESTIYDVVGEMAEVARPLHCIARIIQTPQAEEFCIELVWERPDPRAQFLSDELFKDAGKRILGAALLKSRRLVDQCDNADICQSSHKEIGCSYHFF